MDYYVASVCPWNVGNPSLMWLPVGLIISLDILGDQWNPHVLGQVMQNSTGCYYAAGLLRRVPVMQMKEEKNYEVIHV